MLDRDEVQRAREVLGEVLDQIDAQSLTATRSERAVISGAVAALTANDEATEGSP